MDIEKVEILNKVKLLFLIPKMGSATVKQVAEYFEVPLETIQGCYKDNKKEIDNDGVTIKTFKDFLTVGYPQLVKMQGKTVFQVTESITLEIPNRGIKVFPQRAILRIAMLLRDSVVAKEIRTQLLNVLEHATPQQRISEIEAETAMLINLGKAAAYGSKEDYIDASREIFAYNNRYIAELKQNNKALADGILEWSDRAMINKAIRLITSRKAIPFGFIWKEFYDELLYKHHIGLKSRGAAPYIQPVREGEWKYVVQTLSALCESVGLSVNEVFSESKL